MIRPDSQGHPAEADVEVQLEAMADRFIESLRAGEVPDRDALISEHPEIEDLARRHLALVEMLHRADMGTKYKATLDDREGEAGAKGNQGP